MDKDIELQTSAQGEENLLYNVVCDIIEAARSRVATYANTEVMLTNWHVGKRIKVDVLFNRRAEYGQQVVKRLAQRLVHRYGAGWKDRKLLHCIRVHILSQKTKLCVHSTYTIDVDSLTFAV